MTRVLALSFLLLSCSLAVAVHTERIRAREAVMQKRLVHKVNPIFPAEARRTGGTVVFQAIISKTGDVDSLKLINGPPILVPAARDAAKQWKYQPYLLNGFPVSVETTITVNFPHSKAPAKGTVGSVPGGIPPGQQGGIVL